MTRHTLFLRIPYLWPSYHGATSALLVSCRPVAQLFPSANGALSSTSSSPTSLGLAGRPWQRVHVDFAGPINGKMFILLVDAHSKWPEVFEMPNTTSQKTIEILRQVFSAYGLSEQIVSDNGPQFISREFAEFMAKNGIKYTLSAPYHPATNGQLERFVQTFKRAMKTGITKVTLNQRLCSFLLSYRTTPHSVTNVPSCVLFLQREVRTRLHLLRETTEQQVCKKQAEQKWHHDKKARDRESCQEIMAVIPSGFGAELESNVALCPTRWNCLMVGLGEDILSS